MKRGRNQSEDKQKKEIKMMNLTGWVLRLTWGRKEKDKIMRENRI